MSDFGLAKLGAVSAGTGVSVASHSPLPSQEISAAPPPSQHTGCCGTLRYMAPEVAQGTRYDLACDVFSFGMLLWEVMHEARPFAELVHDAGAALRIIQGERPPLQLAPARAKFEEIIIRCWDQSPTQRPSMVNTLDQLKILEDA